MRSAVDLYTPRTYSDEKNANRDTKVWHATRKGSLNDGQIQNPSNPFGIVPLSNFAPRGFGFVHHSMTILYHEVPNPSITIRTFLHRCRTEDRVFLQVTDAAEWRVLRAAARLPGGAAAAEDDAVAQVSRLY
jgi:hypothetical protein